MEILGSLQRVVTSRRASTAGFTAIKLLVTVTLIGILASPTVPALRDLVLNNRAVSRINEFMAAVNPARNEPSNEGYR